MIIHYCDSCKKANSLEELYSPINSEKGAKVFICRLCSLVQTKYDNQILKDEFRKKTISSDANWGNVRHGKGLRFSDAKNYLEPILEKYKPERILDIGCNRGDFVKYIIKKDYAKKVIGIEPDKSLLGDYEGNLLNDKLEIIWDCFENVNLTQKFDFIYSSQTLEHSRSALEMLQKSFDILDRDGIMYIEVPELNIIEDKRSVEEFFIDKHTFHFTFKTLLKLAENLGFELIEDFNSDDFNIKLLFKKGNKKSSIEKDNFTSTLKKIEKYKSYLIQNHNILKRIVDLKLSPLAKRQKVAFWGANRIFDSLLKYGGLSKNDIFMLVDSYMCGKLDSNNGIKIEHPDYLRVKEPQICVILARSSEDYLANLAYEMGIRHVLKFSEIFDQINN